MIKQCAMSTGLDGAPIKTKSKKKKSRKAAPARQASSRSSSRGGITVNYNDNGNNDEEEEEEEEQREMVTTDELQPMLVELVASMKTMLQSFPLRNHADLLGQTIETMIHAMQISLSLHQDFRAVLMGE